MINESLIKTYENKLDLLSKTQYFGGFSVTHFLTLPELKFLGIGDFYKNNALKTRGIINTSSNRILVTKEEYPNICGGVTEYLTKIKLARSLKIDLVNLDFFDDYQKDKYKSMDDEDLAFYMYEHAIFYRSGMGYTKKIFHHKDLIVKKAILLSSIALKLINETFPTIESINFHPSGHVHYQNKIAIKGDSDLLINNCLIDFKTKKDYKVSLQDRAQLFAYSINRCLREGNEYERVYILNPSHNLLIELL